MEYKAVPKRNPDTELTHWKYIKREKVNGKWRYYYDDSELRKFSKGVTETSTLKDGTKVTTEYKQTDNTFGGNGPKISNFATFDYGDGTVKTYKSVRTSREQGKLDRATAKAEKWIFDNFVDQRKKEQRKRVTEKTIENGKKKVSEFFSKITDAFDGDKKKETTKSAPKTDARAVAAKKQARNNATKKSDDLGAITRNKKKTSSRYSYRR